MQYTLTGLIYAYFMTQAVLYTATGALMPGLIDSYAMTPSQVGYLNSTAAIGMLLANLAGVLVSDRFGKHWLFIAGGILAAVATFWQSTMIVYLPFLVVSFVAGIGRALTNLTGNSMVADLHPERRGFFVGLIHALFGVGALSGPLIGSAFLGAGMDWRSVYAMIAGAQGLLSLLLIASVRLVPPVRLMPGRAGGAGPAGDMPMRPVLLIALGMAFYTSSQTTVVTWYPTFVQTYLGLDQTIGSWALTFFWTGAVLGRIATMWISDRFESRGVLVLYAGLGAVFTASTILFREPSLIYGTILMSGLTTGGIWPQALAYVYRVAPHATGRVTGMITLATGIGAILLPSLTGWVAETTTLSGALWSGFVYVAISCILFALAPRQEVQEAERAA